MSAHDVSSGSGSSAFASSLPTLDAETLLTVWETGASQVPLQRASTLLGAAWPDLTVAQWAGLSIGGRDRHLLELQDALFGSALEVVTGCPACGEQIELAFTTDDIRVPGAGPGGDVRLEASGWQVRSRPPTTLDLLDVGDRAEGDARLTLLERCVLAASHEGTAVDPAALPDDVVTRIVEELARADPQADVQVALSCPECGLGWSVAFDIASYLWSEVEEWAQRVLEEVHALASSYGWREQEILQMTAGRRRLYLEMLGT